MESYLFRTPVQTVPSAQAITYQKPVVLMGSCFTDHIGRLLQEAHFPLSINPFGTLYNPVSILNGLERIIQNRPYTAESLIRQGDIWCSLDHHGSFDSTSQEEVLHRINASLANAHRLLKKTSHLVLTFGTSYVFKYLPTGQIVSNCHKLPGDLFSQTRLSVEETVQTLQRLVKIVNDFNPDLQFVFTVSPIRHHKDDLHRNQVSKSTLITAIALFMDSLAADSSIHPSSTYYFPAYEIMMDDLRDYRFYEQDMMHPNATAIDYIWNRFSQAFFSPETQSIIEKVKPIQAALKHRPLHPDTEAYVQFRSRILQQIDGLKKACPYLDFTQDMEGLS